jgi:biotin transport system substrate-specific component
MSSMSSALARRPQVLSDLIPGAVVRDLALVLSGAALTGALAQLSVPVPGSPVPITGQTLGVLLVGAALGWRRGFAALGLYLLAGMAGVPWYANHASGASLPDLGYIIGFVLAAAAVGALAGHGGDRTPLRTIGTMIIGTVIIYAVGVPYLMADLHVGLSTAWNIGIKNYLPGDAAKLLIAAGLLPASWRALGYRRPQADS